jgi:hypothetical protein
MAYLQLCRLDSICRKKSIEEMTKQLYDRIVSDESQQLSEQRYFEMALLRLHTHRELFRDRAVGIEREYELEHQGYEEEIYDECQDYPY